MYGLSISNYNLYFKIAMKYEGKIECCIFKICNCKFREMHKNIDYLARKYNLNKDAIYIFLEYLEEKFKELKTEKNINEYMIKINDVFGERRK